MNPKLIKNLLESKKDKVCFFDFDETLFLIPTINASKILWKQATGKDFDESKYCFHDSPDSFNDSIIPFELKRSVYKEYLRVKDDSITVILTHRKKHLKKEMKWILDRHGIKMDYFVMENNNGSRTNKAVMILDFLKDNNLKPKMIEVWDDKADVLIDLDKFQQQYGKDFEIKIHRT